MYSPVAPRRQRTGELPVPKNQFQRELDAKMADRRHRGLSAEMTSDGSEEELPSDDGEKSYLSHKINGDIFVSQNFN